MKEPMLAFQYTQLKPEERENIWNSREWFLTEKENGVRGIIVYTPSEGLSLYSRNVSVTDFLPIDYAENLLHTIQPGEFPHPFVLDVEIKSTNHKVCTYLERNSGVLTETELQAVCAILAINKEDSLEIQRAHEDEEPLLEFKLIDVLHWPPDGDMRKLPYRQRRKHYNSAVESVRAAGLNLKRILHCVGDADKKRAFHDGILARGGEGTVAVNLNATYNDEGTRHRDKWVKVKRSVSGSLQQEGLGDTIDGWISGFEEADEEKGWKGMIGALLISVTLSGDDGVEREHLIAKVTNIPLSQRKEMTRVGDDGKVYLEDDYYGKVVEVDGQAIAPRVLRLTHPRIIRFRTDKNIEECVVSESFLRSMVL